ncbi:MAG: hypothetical protein H7256_12995, partial [Bdellovibrio sp.]|nr:hypothetical protein [Bdellovibrio sp.]
TLKISLDVDSTGKEFLKKLYQSDQKYFESNKQWMTEKQLAQQIETQH